MGVTESANLVRPVRSLTVRNIGRLYLAHATSRTAGREIKRTGTMVAGASGRLGGGIYWAEAEDIARRKSLHDGRGRGAVVFAWVTMDKALVIQGNPNTWSIANLLRSYGANSVKWLPAAGLSSPGWEFVVYDSWRVEVVHVVTDP
jgi:hypothetical protein